MSDEIHAFHGFLGSSSDFDLLQSSFFRLVTHDLIGHGSHDCRTAQEFETERQVQYWRARLPQQSILLGYSMGGRLALQIATRYPRHFRGLILIGVSAGLRGEKERKARKEWDLQMASKLESGMESFLALWNQLPIIASQMNIDREHRRRMQENRLQQSPTQLALSLQYFGSGTMPSCWHLLDNLQLPVLLLSGEYDHKYRMIAEKMNVLLPNAEHVVVSQSGHCCHLERPKESLQYIENWLAGL